MGKGKALVVELGPQAPKRPVPISDINGKANANFAKQKAGAFHQALKTITPDQTAIRFTPMWHIGADVYAAICEDWSNAARNVFMYELGKKFGGVSAFAQMTAGDNLPTLKMLGIDDLPFTVSSAGDLAKIHWVNANSNLPKPYNVSWQPTDAVIVVPLSDPILKQGFTIVYQMQAMHEEGTSKGVENYVDVYVSAEGKFPGIPLIKDVLSIDIRAGVKKGSKKYTKVEVKDATRSGPQVSKTYTLQEVTRNSVIVVSRPDFSAGWDYLTVEKGWRIVPKADEGGKTLGPFWPWYRLDGREAVSGSAVNSAIGALNETLEAAAIELARLLPRLK